MTKIGERKRVRGRKGGSQERKRSKEGIETEKWEIRSGDGAVAMVRTRCRSALCLGVTAARPGNSEPDWSVHSLAGSPSPLKQ